ncbi:peptide chain release factor N(5)-glutamine methyltransferase [Caecibacteroides pullorum]|uniref:Release factor glutamine methyltransferase n=1 Tax=Caecibacteroides pullorum TaxID=2725562 RepID=A0AA41D8W2_9BACT|nr:peptide chain release factor N(5)-glutamine methyltransferase [Caecibacteroides pullorum]MBM6857119.1 peptide chain release factor N(5)-glutamine methyltransferase [Caecibacteroides pullorum]MBV8058124.1 peptide chain release factor N(5)-glutamine methyltransferase [Caecibacteroides pullorum]
MNKIVAYIRSRLQPYYTAEEVSALSRIVCCDLLGQAPTDYYLGKDIALSPKKEQELEDILQRLSRFEPLQYIEGRTLFLGREFWVAPGVLIPRPETEELVELMLKEIPADARILDVGTGSGCIAISLAKELPDALVTAWDVSPEALSVARVNARKLQANVRFVECDVLACQVDEVGLYDVIVSNPPYVTEAEKADMEPNVLQWEPSLALFVPDDDPLRFYRRIAVLGRDMLADGGRLYFEINRAYGREMVEMLRTMGYVRVRVKKDLSQNDRFVIAEK